MSPRRRLTRRTMLGTLAAWPWVTPRARESEPLRIGVTAVILADQAAFLARWAEYLRARTGSAVQFVVREEYQPVLEKLLVRELDAAWICGFPYVRHRGELQLLAAPMFRGRPLYQAYLIRTRGQAAVNGWADLRGRVLAMSDPLSNSGWLVARAQLYAAGLAEQDLRRGFFAHGHRNVAEAVAVGLADAGSIDGYVWETMHARGLDAARGTEVVWRSPWFGFPPIVAPSGREPTALRDALLAMGNDAAARPLLDALNLDGFTAATPALYDSIRELARGVPGTGVA